MNPEHVKVVRQGSRAIDAWREEHPDALLDLSETDLSVARLSRAVLPGADLRGADLSGADLRDAQLSLADLSGADLSGADLSRAAISEADLRGADLSGTQFGETYFIDANLTGASLVDANFDSATLLSADLSKADLTHARFDHTRLEATIFAGAVFGWSSLGPGDWSGAIGLGLVTFAEPSYVTVDALAQTLRGSGGRFTDDLMFFFEGAGVPRTLLEYLPGLLEANPLQFYSCFISYSTADEAFAEQLNQDLNRAGVRTWKWDLDAVPGRDLRENIDRAVRNYDKMILVCSVASLTSDVVEREVERALRKEADLSRAAERSSQAALEAREPSPHVDKEVLVPIRIDDTLFNWDSQYAADVTRRFTPDFSNAPADSEKYQKQLSRLIDALNPATWPPRSPGSART